MAKLTDDLQHLVQVLDVLDDEVSAEQVEKALTEVSATVIKQRRHLEELGVLYGDPTLPSGNGAAIDRWDTVVAKLAEMQNRLETAPETVRDGRLWTDTEATVKALLRDLDQDVRTRWASLNGSAVDLDLTFLAGLPPGTAGVDRYREIVARLSAYAASALPNVGDGGAVTKLRVELASLRERLRAHEPPKTLQADLELLEQGRLPIDRYNGELKEYLERTGLDDRLRLGFVGE